MEYKILGKTGLNVSSLAFGALQFARIEQQEAINLVHSAYDYGINDWQTQTCGGVDNTCNTVGTCEIMQWVICSP